MNIDDIIDLDKMDEEERHILKLRRMIANCDEDEARAMCEVIFLKYPGIYLSVLRSLVIDNITTLDLLKNAYEKFETHKRNFILGVSDEKVDLYD